MDLQGSEEQGFEILEALAKIEDVGDFRLREFMPQLGLNPNQPVEFYRALIKAAREIMSFVKLLQETIDTDFKAITQLGTKHASQDQQIKTLGAKLRRLEDEAHRKTESAEKERHQLESNASQLQEKAENYEAIKELLKGQQNTEVVGALYRLFYDMYTDMLHRDLGMQPPPDLIPVAYMRQKLREQLMDVLQIPKDTLETENKRLKDQIDAIVAMLKRVYGG